MSSHEGMPIPAGREVQRRFNPIRWAAVAATIATIAAVACAVWTVMGKGGESASPDAPPSASSSQTLQSSDGDVAGNAENEVLSADTTSSNDMLVITESGWSVDDAGLLRYGLAIRNTSEYDILYPAYKVTGYAKDGSVTFSEESVEGSIYAGETIYAGMKVLEAAAAQSDRVEFTVTQPSEFDLLSASKNPSVYEVKNIGEKR